MKKKQFKSESKKLLNLMINSIYTNKDIFLREIISNANDAIDKLHYNSLTDKSIKLPKNLEINIELDKVNKTITISDNGIGMTYDELDNNLGTIAESDSSNFKETIDKTSHVIGQFGVGFYSIFMVAKKVDVISKSYKDNNANIWSSEGLTGYTIDESQRKNIGTDVIIYLKDDEDDFKYSDYLEEYKIKELINKYSNYISYPIKMEITEKELVDEEKNEYKETKKLEVLNEITPIWKKSKVKDDEYNLFYIDKFNDYNNPLKVIKYKNEGLCSFDSLLFIPSKAPYNYYTKDYNKGLKLYSNGVLIMDNCEDLLNDQYSFVKGIVDSDDISLNISREMLQQDKQLKTISKSINKKINSELSNMLKEDRENYEKFYKEFGIQLKVSIYNSYGMIKDEIQDLLMFYNSNDKKLITFNEYISKMKEGQDSIYYAVGESLDKIDILPQVEDIKEKGYVILYLTDYADEFVLQMLQEYDNKKFVNIESSDLSLDTEEEKEKLEKLNGDNLELLNKIKDVLKGKVTDVKFSNNLKNHPVCLKTEGNISTGMEKIINAMPNEERVQANKVLIINANHDIVKKLENVYEKDKEELEKYAKILYAQARLVDGLNIENTNEFSELVCELLSK